MERCPEFFIVTECRHYVVRNIFRNFAPPRKETPAIAAALGKVCKKFMYWIILLFAGLMEVAFTFCLGKTKTASGHELAWWWIGFVVAMTLSMLMMAKAAEKIPIGTVYPVWTGIGAVGAVVVGILFFNEPASFWRIFFITTLIASIIGLKTLG